MRQQTMLFNHGSNLAIKFKHVFQAVAPVVKPHALGLHMCPFRPPIGIPLVQRFKDRLSLEIGDIGVGMIVHHDPDIADLPQDSSSPNRITGVRMCECLAVKPHCLVMCAF